MFLYIKIIVNVSSYCFIFSESLKVFYYKNWMFGTMRRTNQECRFFLLCSPGFSFLINQLLSKVLEMASFASMFRAQGPCSTHCSSWAVLCILEFDLGGPFRPVWFFFLVVLPFPVRYCWCDVLSATNEGIKVRPMMPPRTNSPQWVQPDTWHKKLGVWWDREMCFQAAGHLQGEKGRGI